MQNLFRPVALVAALTLPMIAQAQDQATPAATMEITGDVKKGKKVFKKCKACHTVKEGKNKTGPSLYGIVGASAGGVEKFKYSKSLSESGLVWDVETLTAFLTDPKGTVPGNKMSFKGLKKEKDIVDLIAYLHDAAQG
ncbi:MAG: c-type cytochrome [Pelagimonas sp.]|jgi:cytochrome c2|nr:c-type cytochrome [Pelagimonas sp.]